MRKDIIRKVSAAALAAVLLSGTLAACGRAPELTGKERSGLSTTAEIIRGERGKALKISGDLRATAQKVRTAWDSVIGEYSGIRDEDTLRCLRELDKQKLLYPQTGEPDRDEEGVFAIRTTGGYTLSEEDNEMLQNMLASVYVPGYTMGFVMMDLGTGKGVTFNTDESYYSASSTKGPFVVSLIKDNPDAAERRWQELVQVTVNSDNDTYFVLEYDYGQDALVDFAANAGVKLVLEEGGFAEITAEDLARLWLANYDYFQTGQQGEAAGSLLETPTYSAICSSLGSYYVTRTKPGWIAGELHNASMDAGIIYADEHPYLMVVMSDFPSNLEDLQDTVILLDQLHSRMFAETDPAAAGENAEETDTENADGALEETTGETSWTDGN